VEVPRNGHFHPRVVIGNPWDSTHLETREPAATDASMQAVVWLAKPQVFKIPSVTHATRECSSRDAVLKSRLKNHSFAKLVSFGDRKGRYFFPRKYAAASS
jgi:hypothetical protein